MARGVTFEICEITLRNRKLKKEQFILGPTFTPSGVVRIAQLQAREQYVYIKP
jgi:intracellular sulfur oxidation DsrE/DsrF family protein